MLNVFAWQWRSGWCLKLIYGMAIASHAPICFRFGTTLIVESSRIASQRQCRKCHLCASKADQSFFFKRPALYTFVKAGEKSIGKALLQVGFLSYLGSHNLHTQVVLLGKKLNLRSPPFMVNYERRTDSDWLTDGLRSLSVRKASGPSSRLRFLPMIIL